MNTQATLEQMKQLRFNGMAEAYHEQLQQPLHQQLDGHELVAHLIQTEQLSRQQEKTAYFLRLAKLRLPAIPEQVTCSASRNLTKQQLANLLQGQYLLPGMPTRTPHYLPQYEPFIEKVTLAKLDGTYIKLLNYLERQTLIILDDFGLQPLTLELKLALLQVIEERHGKRSTIITSQLPVASWHQYLNEPTVADAIMDRLTAREHRIELQGDSLRRKK